MRRHQTARRQSAARALDNGSASCAPPAHAGSAHTAGFACSLVAAALFLAACDSLPFEPAGPEAAPDPAKMGPFPVGVRTLTIRDPERLGTDGAPRTLVTEVWYPAGEEARGGPGAIYDVRSLLTAEQAAASAGAPVPVLVTSAVRDAAPDEDHGPFPLVVFSHGQAAVRWQSTYLTVQLASHGFVVAAPDHQWGTLKDALHGTMEDSIIGFKERPRDVTSVIDHLALLPEGQPLAGLVNSDRVGAAGHSFGGYTSLRVAATDARVKAIVPQAPPTTAIAWFDQPPPFYLSIPVLVQAAHDDRTLPWSEHIDPTWKSLKSPRWLLDLVKGGHFTFSDLCSFDLAALAEQIHLDLAGVDIGNVLDDGCGPGAPAAGVAQPLINHYAIAFFNGVLRESPGSMALLTQAAADRLAPGAAAFTAEP